MKKYAKLICFVLVLSTLLAFSACKKNAPAPAANTLPTDTAAIYYLTGAKWGENEVRTLEELDIADPAECYIFFDLGGVGILCIDGWETFFEYADGQLWEDITPDTKINYIIEGDSLTLEQDGYCLVFTRGDLPEWAQSQDDQEELPQEEAGAESEVVPTEAPAETAAPTEAPAETTAATEAPAETTAATEAPAN